MSESEKQTLCSRYWELEHEFQRARNADQMRLAESFENSMARIEDRLQRYDVDPNDYRPRAGQV